MPAPSTEKRKASPPVGSHVCIQRDELQGVLDELREQGYKTVLPQVRDGAVVYGDSNQVSDLPRGLIDEQDGGTYRLRESGHDGFFDYVVGPYSLKKYLFPPHETVLTGRRNGGQWRFECPPPEPDRVAVIGVRSCDLHALAVQDRVFLEGPYVDEAYRARRENLFLVAVNCRRAASTCFCHSMGTGPQASAGFDLSLSEFERHFIVEIGTSRGGNVIAATDWAPCSVAEIERAAAQSRDLEREMRNRPTRGLENRGRQLDTHGIRDLLLDNLEHEEWRHVAERCLACANCTMVCPTCFCSTVTEVSNLTGDNVRRERTWASCFTSEHSFMSSGVVRQSTEARYRQWLVHKLATWIDQFGVSGCVGCGRCITWCPVGIDLTEEVATIRGTTP